MRISGRSLRDQTFRGNLFGLSQLVRGAHGATISTLETIPAPPTHARQKSAFLSQEPGSQTNSLAQALFGLQQQGKKEEFDALVRSILPEMVDWTIECPVDTDYIHYMSRAGSLHRISRTGDGTVNAFRIAFSLLHLEEGDVLLVDEPELSLHPQAQRRLADLLARLATQYQIVVATHSPHFVSWDVLSKGAKVYRVAQDERGAAACWSLAPATIAALTGIVGRDIRNRRLYDVLSKEVFFSDAVLFTEGPDDVHYIEHYLREGSHCRFSDTGREGLAICNTGCRWQMT